MREDGDDPGRLYERSLPADERHDRGQYYTPPAVVDLLARLCVDTPTDAVLDPACGAGAILAGAQDRLATLADGRSAPGGPDGDPTDRLYGVEVEADPARLAARTLARRSSGADPEDANVAVADFFDVEPGSQAERAGARDGAPVHLPGRVDAVLGNPPYVRQEAIDDVERCRAHLGPSGVGATLDERSDLYAYFLTHAAEFLDDGGRLGLVTPEKWLGVGYGEGLRRFVRSSFRIRAVVGFARRVFADPLVPTCVTVLERCPDPNRRADAVVPFVRVEEETPVADLVGAVTADHEPGALEMDETYRLLAVRQGDLDPAGTWDRYLHAPPAYWRLRDADGLCRLDDLATVTYGTKPGAVAFFFPEPGDLPAGLAEGEWFRPAIKSIRDADRVRFEPGDADRLVLDVHDLVADALASDAAPSTDRREHVRAVEREYRRSADDARRLSDEEVAATAALADRGHDALFEYVLGGVRAGYHDRATCAARRVWFDLGALPAAPIVAGQFVWESAPYLYLPTPLPVSNALCYVAPDDGVDPKLLAAVCNAAATRLVMELHGRTEGGRALQLQVYEREALPVPDVRAFDADDAAAVADAFDALLVAQEDGGDAAAARRELDEAVLAAAGLADLADEVADAAVALTAARTDGKTVASLLDARDDGG